jgi:hypothetical protein
MRGRSQGRFTWLRRRAGDVNPFPRVEKEGRAKREVEGIRPLGKAHPIVAELS